MNKIAFSGTLDPITNGHMWVIGEARALADEVVVFISENPFKQPHFGADQRKAIVEQSLAERGWSNVSVMLVRGDYTVRAAKRHGIDYLIRGIRNTADFDYENLIQQANVDVLQGAKTLFVMPPRDLGSVSSSFVRALQGPVGWHWNMRAFLPGPAYAAWIRHWLQKEWQSLWQDRPADAALAAERQRWFHQLVGESAYGAPHRHYHNLDHLVHGLSEIAVWAANTGASSDDVATLKQAFWFHDAMYDGRQDGLSNEEQSARLWLAAKLGARDDAGVADLIRATDHLQQHAACHRLKPVMLGADLAILGQPPAVYAAYARNVRDEYAGMDEQGYRAARIRVLRHFLGLVASGQLYPDAYFAALYQQQARANMTAELTALSPLH